MKKLFAKVLALVLVMCMVLPYSAMAATTYYVEVSVADDQGHQIKGQSSKYGSKNSLLAAEVVGIISDKYDALATTFAGSGLRGVVDAGLDAFRDGGEAWSAYVDTYYDSVTDAFKDVLKDRESTFKDLTLAHKNTVTWQDPASGVNYTVSVTLRSYKTGSDQAGNQGQHEIIIKPTTPSTPATPETPVTPETPETPAKPAAPGGSASSSHKNANYKEEVTVDVVPDAGSVVNRVIVRDEKGNQIPTKAIDNNTYTFDMPDGDVTVETTFVKAPADAEETGVAQMLKTEEKVAYMQGRDAKTFEPTESVNRAEVATMFYRLLKDTDVASGEIKEFADVKENAWYADAVNTLAALGIIKGMSDTEFAPTTAITRAQFVAICARFAQAQMKGQEFIDVPDNHWAKDYISTAAAFGWINGVTDNEFAPDRPITRAEAAAVVNRVLGRVADRGYIDSLNEQRYDDVHNLNWAWYEINEASMGELSR